MQTKTHLLTKHETLASNILQNFLSSMERDRDYWKKKYEKLEELIKNQDGCKYCIDVSSNRYSRCSQCHNKEHWFFDNQLLID